MAKKIKALSVKRIKDKVQKLKSERGTWESHWQELNDYILPRKNTVTVKRTDGEKRTWQLLDNTGMQSNELLAGFLHGVMTNPNLPWFELTTGDLTLDARDDVRGWLQRQARAMHNVLNNSNFQTEVHELYLDLGSIGTAAMYTEEDEERVVRFETKFIADYYIDESPFGYVDQIYCERKWTAEQLVAYFGEKVLPEKVIKCYKKGDDSLFCLGHAVYPTYLVEGTEAEGASLNDNEFISQYYLPELDYEISVGKFNSFPFSVPRFTKAAGEKYGRSPGMNALPELKVLNKMNETLLIGAQLQVQPPLQMEDDGVVLPLITRPNGINFTRPGAGPIRPIFNDTRLDFGYQAMQDRRQRVKDSFYVDQLKLQQGGPMMTATEVLQRTEESMRLMGPLLGRMQNEFLRPLIDRVFQIMWNRGMIEQPPEVLSGKKIDVRYSSLIAKSQRVSEAQSVLRTLEVVPGLAGFDPSVTDNFSADAIVKILGMVYGAPNEMYRTTKERDAMRAARAQAQNQMLQSQQDANQVQMGLTVAKTMNEAGMNGQTQPA